MKISDVLRGLIDVVDQNSESPVVAGQEENTSFTGSLKPVALPDIKSQNRVERGAKAPDGLATEPDELFVPPLQQKIELLKKAVDVENIYDSGSPEQQEEARQEKDGEWTGPEHHYEYVGAQTGVVEGGSKDTTDKEETVTVGESMRKFMRMVGEESQHQKDEKAEKAGKKVTKDIEWDEKHRTDESHSDIMRGLLDSLNEDKADRDYDGDGEVESEKDEIWGSRMKAAKKAGKMEEEQLDEAGNLLKSIKRGLQGWGELSGSPKELVKRNKGYDMDTAKDLWKYVDKEQGSDSHSPAALQHRVLRNKLKKAGQLDERGEPADEQAVRELVLFADNDGNLYRQSYEPIIKNLQKKVAKGVYDPEMAIKLWKYHADRAAQAYGREFGGQWNQMFNPATRMAAAKEFEEAAREEIGADQLNELSKDTLKSYLKKAGSQLRKHANRSAAGLDSPEDSRSIRNRGQGLDRALDRLTGEELWEEGGDIPEPYRIGTRVTVDGKPGEINHVRYSDSGDHKYKVTDLSADDPYRQTRLRGNTFISHSNIEPADQLDELSRDTLKSYIKKAGDDAITKAHFSGSDYEKGDIDSFQQNYGKLGKRSQGIGRALDRLEEGRIDPVEAYNILDDLGLMGRDFFTLSNDEVNALMDQAKRLGYKSDRRTAPGSPARMFFQYLTRMADGVARRRAARGIGEYADAGHGSDWQMDEECGMSRIRELAGMSEGDDEEPELYDLGYEEDDDYEPEADDLSDFGFQSDEEDLWESDIKRIKELATNRINPVVLDELASDFPEE